MKSSAIVNKCLLIFLIGFQTVYVEGKTNKLVIKQIN